MEPTSEVKSRRPIALLLTIIASIALAVAGYFVMKKFQKDRKSAMNFEPRVERKIVTQNGTQTTTRTYTREELEEARKTGKLPKSVSQPYIPPNAAGDAAVQRSLKTLDEVNRINEMNRRLIEQQQRQQK